jgi:uncharacterized SAM-binding protein YcdF (DUF218 family)
MKKFLLIFGIVIGALSLIVLGLNALLTPNDLKSCQKSPTETEKCYPADAIIAVSGGDTSARAKSAVELYQNGWAKQIIFSGAARDPESESNAKAMRDLAIKAGVPKSVTTIEEASQNTRQNAENAVKILKKLKVKTAILTTSPYHMRRVLLEFQRAVPDVEFRARPSDDKYWRWWFFKPAGWWRAINELGGLIVFGIRGTI